jgi:hypothetical protein
MTECYAHVVDMATKNPPLFIPVKVGEEPKDTIGYTTGRNRERVV